MEVGPLYHVFYSKFQYALFVRLFDHWAHLGGAAFGAFYYYYGPSQWSKIRKEILDAEQSSS